LASASRIAQKNAHSVPGIWNDAHVSESESRFGNVDDHGVIELYSIEGFEGVRSVGRATSSAVSSRPKRSDPRRHQQCGKIGPQSTQQSSVRLDWKQGGTIDCFLPVPFESAD
jgi:hypothetical protein